MNGIIDTELGYLKENSQEIKKSSVEILYIKRLSCCS